MKKEELITPDWVNETLIGKWFLSTGIWVRYVLAEAIATCQTIAGDRVTGVNCLLDIGCGQGLAFPLLEQSFQPKTIIGIDIDERLVRRASWAAALCMCPVQVKQGSVTYLDMPDGSVDMIFCHQLIHHVINQEGALKELYRVLAPGGWFMMCESCESFIHSWPVRSFFRHPEGVQKSAEGYLDLLRSIGFEFSDRDVRTSAPWWSLPDLGLGRKFRLTSQEPIATEVVVVARKKDRRQGVTD